MSDKKNMTTLPVLTVWGWNGQNGQNKNDVRQLGFPWVTIHLKMSKLDKSVSRISMQIFIEGKLGHARGRAGFNPYHMQRYTRGQHNGSTGNNYAWYITSLTHGHIGLASLWPAGGCALFLLWTWLLALCWRLSNRSANPHRRRAGISGKLCCRK